MSEKVLWPSWRFGPNGQSDVFDSADDVPVGWQDHPSKVGEKPAKAPPTAPEGEAVELDASGQAWNPDLHAPTKTKTNAGLWRMKVGVSRPPVLDL